MPPNDAPAFVRALLTLDQGRLAYFFRAMAQMAPVHLRLILNLDSPDAALRVTAARRLRSVFERIASNWAVDERAFWRPELDPTSFIADLRSDDAGRPFIPGTQAFWNAAFDDAAARREDIRALTTGEPADFVWLCEQVFAADRGEQRRRYDVVMFASRTIPRVTPENAQDAIDAVRGAFAYPALVRTLERVQLRSLAAYGAAVRRATALSAIADDVRAARADAQFQGALMLLTRATVRGGLAPDSLPQLVSSLAAVDTSERGDYDGRLVRWLDVNLIARAAKAAPDSSDPKDSGVGPYDSTSGVMDEDVLVLMSGAAEAESRFVEWEGMRYRLDFRTAEATRLAKHLGDRPRPYLSSARTIAEAADVLEGRTLTRDALGREAEAIDRIAQAGPWFETDEDTSRASGRFRDLTAAVQREARNGDVRSASRLVPALREMADEFLARGLMELAYAAALGQPDRTPIDASDAASRHDFGLRPANGRRNNPWRFPIAGAEGARGWHVRGSLLSLDVALAEFALVPLSSRPPARRPTLNDEDRRVFSQAAVLIEPMSLDDETGATIISAIRRGRARLAAVRTPIEAAAVADESDLGAVRRYASAVGHCPSARSCSGISLPERAVQARADRHGRQDRRPEAECLGNTGRSTHRMPLSADDRSSSLGRSRGPLARGCARQRVPRSQPPAGGVAVST